MSLLRISAVALAAGFVALVPAAPVLAAYGPNSIASATGTALQNFNGTSTVICADSFKPSTPLTFAGPGIGGTGNSGPARTSNINGNTVGTGAAPTNCVTGTPTDQTAPGPDGASSTYSITGADGHASGTVTRTIIVRRYFRPLLAATDNATQGSDSSVNICDTQYRSPSTLTVYRTLGSGNPTVVATRAAGLRPCFNTGQLANNTATKYTFTDAGSQYNFITKTVSIDRKANKNTFTYTAFSVPSSAGAAGSRPDSGPPLAASGLAIVFLSGSVLTYRQRRAL